MPIPLAVARNAASLRRWGSRHLLIMTLTVANLSLIFSPLLAAPALAADISLKATVSNQPALNQTSEIKVTINTPTMIKDGVVDLEIYDADNNRVFQKFTEHQNLNPQQDYQYTANWQPVTAGTYKLKVGIFDSSWSKLLFWNDSALVLSPGSVASSSTSIASVTADPASPLSGSPVSFKVAVKPASDLSNGIIDMEIYDSANTRIFQKFESGQNLKSGSGNTYNFVWTPAASGTYKVKLGVFNQGWSTLQSWNDNALELTVGKGTSVQAPAVQPSVSAPANNAAISASQVTASGAGYNVGGDGRIYDQSGKELKINGVSWFGFENGTMVLHGLWDRNWQDMVKQIKDSGFNALRVPYCPNTLKNSEIGYINTGLNPDLVGLKSLDIMDKYLTELNRQGMYFMLDLHTSDCNTITDLWTVDGYSEQQWIDDLVFLANRYKGLNSFIGIDIKNEPKGIATWGTGDSKTDWKMAAEKAGKAILSANPNILIFVQGVQDNPVCSDNSNGHWWGGNLEPESCHPIQLPANKVVFTPHVYGPDVHAQGYFNDAAFPSNMTKIWETHFGFLRDQKKAVAIGEWGGKYGQGDQKDVIWQNSFVDYMIKKGICNSFYWSWNPNSTDTGGILNDDWKTVRQDKLDLINRYVRECR